MEAVPFVLQKVWEVGQDNAKRTIEERNWVIVQMQSLAAFLRYSCDNLRSTTNVQARWVLCISRAKHMFGMWVMGQYSLVRTEQVISEADFADRTFCTSGVSGKSDQNQLIVVQQLQLGTQCTQPAACL